MVTKIGIVGTGAVATRHVAELIGSAIDLTPARLSLEEITNHNESPEAFIATGIGSQRIVLDEASMLEPNVSDLSSSGYVIHLGEGDGLGVDYAHISIEGQVTFLREVDGNLVSAMNEYIGKVGIVVQSDRHLFDMLSQDPTDFIKCIDMDMSYLYDNQTFKMDFTRPIIRDQVIMKKPRHLIKKIIH